MTPAISLPTVLALDRSSKNAVGVIADTVVGHITTQGPGKVALWGVSRGDTPVRV